MNHNTSIFFKDIFALFEFLSFAAFFTLVFATFIEFFAVVCSDVETGYVAA